MSPQGPTEVIIGVTEVENCPDDHGSVRFAAASQQPNKNKERLNLVEKFCPPRAPKAEMSGNTDWMEVALKVKYKIVYFRFFQRISQFF